jgi:uncharacterized protein (DUF1501 family)
MPLHSPISRRSAIGLGLGALAAAFVRPSSAAQSPGVALPARACILLYMQGGASQIDTWDPKPGRDTGGPAAAIPTSVPGVHVSEHLPGMARRLDRVALVRSVTAREGNHDRARYLMHTGYAPVGATPHPSLGAHVAALHPAGDLPPHVAIGGPGHGAGLLGAAHGPFVIRDATRPVRYLAPSRSVPPSRARDRAELLRAIESDFASDRDDPAVQSHVDVMERALALVGSEAAAAFDLEREPDRMRETYGRSEVGQGCLLARRLVEAGVRFVEVAMPGWDTHEDAFDRTRELCGPLDTGMSALLDDLDARGLLDETLVVWLGDFGRTPAINARGGRDHFPRISSVVLAGAGLPGGAVIGRTDADGLEILDDPVTVPDLMRTIASRLGLDPDETHVTPGGRPITTVDGGQPIAGLDV